MYYYVYMLKVSSPLVKKTYVGYSIDIKKRLNKHNTNKGAKSTRGYKWVLIYSKKFDNKSDALSYEYKLKKNRLKRNSILINFDK